jgi:hypothetical protein
VHGVVVAGRPGPGEALGGVALGRDVQGPDDDPDHEREPGEDRHRQEAVREPVAAIVVPCATCLHDRKQGR